ncbi:unnamed protein product, partial [Polarella glacialis]
VSISIASWRAMVVVDVTFQQQFGAQSERVASAMWDPWVEKVLEKSLVNWPICNPTNKQSLQWDSQKLLETDGVPKPHTYSEFRLDLSPSSGLLSFQATYLGPMRLLAERTEPTDAPMR